MVWIIESTYDSVAVKVRLQLALAPGVEGALLGRGGGLREVAGHRRVVGPSGLGGRCVRGLCGANQVVSARLALLGNLLGRSIAVGDQVVPRRTSGVQRNDTSELGDLLQVLIRVFVERIRVPGVRGSVVMFANKGTELVLL
jgi:hypothetical protein